MSTPRHLWSGDWERDSAALSDALATLEELPRVTPEPVPQEDDESTASTFRQAWERLRVGERLRALRLPRPSRRVRRTAALVLVALVGLAAVAYGLGALVGALDSAGGSSQSSGPSGPMRWLGMEIESLSPNGVVVATVAPGSQAEQAGLEPGDIIVQIGSRLIHSTGDLANAVAGLPAGDQVQLEVSRGSTPFTTSVTLGAAPSSYP
jgi:membrane-associated protease RseP (regulator of RpoE activity)